MKATSTIQYTFEDMDGYAETFSTSDFKKILEGEVIEGSVTLDLNGEDDFIKAPILKGYKEPYDSDITDDIGTEHYIYYEELKS